MTRSESSIKKLVGILILVVSVFVTGFAVGRVLEDNTGGVLKEIKGITTSEDVNFDLFWDVWNTIEDGYVDEEKVDQQSMFYGSIKGMVGSINDSATVFLDPDETEEFNLFK